MDSYLKAHNLLATTQSLEPFVPESQQNALYALELLSSLQPLTAAHLQASESKPTAHEALAAGVAADDTHTVDATKPALTLTRKGSLPAHSIPPQGLEKIAAKSPTTPRPLAPKFRQASRLQFTAIIKAKPENRKSAQPELNPLGELAKTDAPNDCDAPSQLVCHRP